MTPSASPLEDPELAAAEWDLGPLVDGEGDEGAERRVAEAAARAAAFAGEHAGRLAQLDETGLVDAAGELTAIRELAGRARFYAELRVATDTGDSERASLLQRVRERLAEIDAALIFFDLEWTAIPDSVADRLLAAVEGEPGFPGHHLRRLRDRRPHLLSEPEERIMADKRLPARDAWARMFDELTTAILVKLDGEEVSLTAAYNRRTDPDREVRRAAHTAMMAALEPGIETRTLIFNTLIHEQSVDDRLRRYPNWLASRNLSNETAAETVQALVDAVCSRRDIPQRWFALKARLMGVDRSACYDRGAPVQADAAPVSFAEARELVSDAYADFSPAAGAIVRRFFDEHWIDAPLRDRKALGAFCEVTVPSVHPYVLLNYSGRQYDVLVMAHELGHGLHAVLAQRQSVFEQETPVTIAETASTFGEALVFERLLGLADDDRGRLGLLGGQIDNAVDLVFNAIVFNRFEDIAHTRRRAEGELSAQTLGDLWIACHTEMYGNTLEIPPGTEREWSIIPHFIQYPGYVYAYAYGQLLALSAYARYREAGDAFVPSYLAMLAAGGSRSPEALAEMIGIDLGDPGVWHAGLKLIDDRLHAAEVLAENLSAA